MIYSHNHFFLSFICILEFSLQRYLIKFAVFSFFKNLSLIQYFFSVRTFWCKKHHIYLYFGKNFLSICELAFEYYYPKGPSAFYNLYFILITVAKAVILKTQDKLYLSLPTALHFTKSSLFLNGLRGFIDSVFLVISMNFFLFLSCSFLYNQAGLNNIPHTHQEIPLPPAFVYSLPSFFQRAVGFTFSCPLVFAQLTAKRSTYLSLMSLFNFSTLICSTLYPFFSDSFFFIAPITRWQTTRSGFVCFLPYSTL